MRQSLREKLRCSFCTDKLRIVLINSFLKYYSALKASVTPASKDYSLRKYLRLCYHSRMWANYKYYFFLLAAAFCYAGISVFVVFLTNHQIDAFTQIQGRAFFGALTTLLILKFILKKDISFTKKEFIYLLFSSFLLLGAYTTAVLSVYMGTPIAKAGALIFTYPLSVVIFSYLFLKDIPSFKQFMAIILSICSAMVLLEIWNIKSLSRITIGEILAFLCAIFYGSIIILGRIIRTKTKLLPFKITFYSLFLLIPQLWILGFILHQFLGIKVLVPSINLQLSVVDWILLLAFGFISTTLPNNLFYFGMKHVKPNVASLLLTTELGWTSILGFLLFGQTLTLWGILGIAGIILAVLLV